MKNLKVSNEYDGKNLNKFILDNIENLSINSLYKLYRKKDIKVNGKRVNKNIIVYNGDEIQVYISDDKLKRNIQILKIYEDENILAVNKPENIEVVGENSLTSEIQEQYKELGVKIHPCHRLDRNTSGVVLFAKNEEALNILLDKFKNHEINKYYSALVYGIPKPKSAKLEAYLFKDSKKAKVYISDYPQKGYKKIITSYKVVKENNNNTCILDINIETGRTHQIRAHLAHIGHPIIGDGKYGINEINKQLGYNHQQLTSYKLQFNFLTDAGILEYLNHLTIEIK